MIDEARLQELAEDFGAEEVPELIAVFLDETWEAINGLEALASGQPARELSDQFHFLKGCGRNIGAAVFADQCEVLENSDDPFDAEAYGKLRGAFQDVADYFEADASQHVA
ncbi:MAG: Hpt domain-containing protein [Pseudomonadota bacterium]